MSTSKVAILIDGGFFVRRFKIINGRSPRITDLQVFLDDILDKVGKLTPGENPSILLRSFYYDCKPFGAIKQDPNGKKIDFAQHIQFKTATAFHNELKLFPQLALRLGDLSFDGWKVNENDPGKVYPDFKQKAVDMKIGLDIAWMSGKHIIDKLVLVTGDSDFVSPMKFARREGILVYLYPMQQRQIKNVLKEHADFII